MKVVFSKSSRVTAERNAGTEWQLRYWNCGGDILLVNGVSSRSRSTPLSRYWNRIESSGESAYLREGEKEVGRKKEKRGWDYDYVKKKFVISSDKPTYIYDNFDMRNSLTWI